MPAKWERSHVASVESRRNLRPRCCKHEYQDQRFCGIVSVALAPDNPDWPLASSVEDYTLAQEQHDTPCFGENVSEIWEAPTPALYVDSQGRPRWTRSVSTNVYEPQPLILGFVQMKDWNRDAVYDEMPPTYIHYRIDWRLMINKTIVSRNTEEDIVLEPTSYGPRILQPRLEELLKRKVLSPRSVRADDTDVVVKVTERSEDDFVTQYARTDIDWEQVERRLRKWSELFRKGKKLRVIICFRYLEVSPMTGTNVSKIRGKQVRGAATQQMQTELTTELDAEQAATGRPAAWQHVYALFRCPGPPCDLKPWCWFDSRKVKRFGLKTHHLRTVIRHKESEMPLDTHDHMPEDLRQQIYKEQEQSEQRKQANNTVPSSAVLPIQITNVLPSHASVKAEIATKIEVSPVEISGLRDESLQACGKWQQSQVRNPSLKAEFQKATDFVVERGLDLELLHEDQNPQFLMEEGGVPVGIARRYYRDIKPWAKRRKLEHECLPADHY